MDLALNHFCNLVLVFAHCRWITVVFADILVDQISLWSKDFGYIITHVTIATTKKQKKKLRIALEAWFGAAPVCPSMEKKWGYRDTK